MVCANRKAFDAICKMAAFGLVQCAMMTWQRYIRTRGLFMVKCFYSEVLCDCYVLYSEMLCVSYVSLFKERCKMSEVDGSCAPCNSNTKEGKTGMKIVYFVRVHVIC